MAARLRILFTFAAFAAPTAMFACGSSSTGTSGSAGSSSSGSASSSSSGSSSTSTSGSANSSSSGSAVTDACTNTADQTAIGVAHACTFANDVQSCTLNNVTSGASGIASCLQSTDGLSANCAGCFGTYSVCGVTNCFAQCTGDGGESASGCQSCIQTHCGAAFASCSGITNLNPPTDAGACGVGGGDGG